MSEKSYNLRQPSKSFPPRQSKKMSASSSKSTSGIDARPPIRPNAKDSTSTSTTGPQTQPIARTEGPGGKSHVTPEPAIPATTPSPAQDSDTAGSGLSVISEMKELFAQLSTEMNHRFDAIGADIADTKKSITDLKETVNFNSSKIEKVEKETLPKLKKEIDAKSKEIEDKIILLEMHQRKQNLLVYGVGERGNNENIYSTVHDIFVYFMRITKSEALKIALVNAHRLPAPQHGASNQPAIRPIIIRFVSMADRDRVLNAFEQSRRQRPKPADLPAMSQHPTHPTPQATVMSGQTTAPDQVTLMSVQTTAPGQQFARVTIRTDLPPPMKRERGRLAAVAYTLRKERNLSTRIRINGTKVFIQTRKPASGTGPQPKWTNWEDK